MLGYGPGALSKPLLALAGGPGLIVTARLIDRVGEGIRGAPRDALIADLAPSGVRGAAFGLRQSLDTVGAFLGPLLAVGRMMLWANDFGLWPVAPARQRDGQPVVGPARRAGHVSHRRRVQPGDADGVVVARGDPCAQNGVARPP